ncbi:MAG: CotH kinase family protein [Defluviitaleaceae bacterium]|nr:CotH kinase family protein [Defluviitaleaceae bacterium]
MKKYIIFVALPFITVCAVITVWLFITKPVGEAIHNDGIAPPVFSHASGFYTEAFYLTLGGAPEGGIIRFTLDGSEPTPRSRIYNAPIRVLSPAVTLHGSPLTAAIRRDSVPRPYYNGMVVRARIFIEGNEASPVVTRSYFVREAFDVRVVSVTVEPSDFVSSGGMYTNYNDDIRGMAYVEVFYPDGTPMLSQYARLQVAGKWSRRERKKSLRLNFNAGCGIFLHADLIPDAAHGTFRNVNLRTSDLHFTTIKEALTARVSEPLRPDIHHSTPAAVFINGEFWGMYCLREHRSRTQIAARHPHINERDVVMMEFAWNIRNDGVYDFDGPFGLWLDADGRLPRSHPLYRVDVEEGDEAYALASWMRMYDAIVGGDMSRLEDYSAAAAYVCMDNLIDWFIVYYHFDNWDFPGNNFVTWKETGGKWKFIVHDFDEAMWQPRRNSMNLFTTPYINNPLYHDNQPLWATELFRNLLESEAFRNTLAARYATYVSTVFHPDRVIRIIDELEAERAADIGRSFFRWNKHGGDLTESVAHWRNAVDTLRGFARVRGDYGIRHMRGYFNRTDRPHLDLGLSGSMLEIDYHINPSEGYLDIAGAIITPDLFTRGGGFTASYIWGLPIGITAVPFEGYAFSHFEIQSTMGDIQLFENPLTIDLSDISPPPGTSAITLTAVFIYKGGN